MTMLNDSGFRQIREAQDETARQVPRTYVVYRNTINFPALGLLADGIHYTQAGLNDVGTVSADSIVLIEKGQQTSATLQIQSIRSRSKVNLSLMTQYGLPSNTQARVYSVNGKQGCNLVSDAGGSLRWDFTTASGAKAGCEFYIISFENFRAYPVQIQSFPKQGTFNK
jgi:hypothetical protein